MELHANTCLLQGDYERGDQREQVVDESKKTYSREKNKNTLELKTARDEPALTYSSHVLEAVMLKAPKEMIKMLSRSKVADVLLLVRKRCGKRKGKDYQSLTEHDQPHQQKRTADQLWYFWIRVHRRMRYT